MQTIHKFSVPIDDEFTIEMPAGAQILSVQAQRGEPVLWALVDNTEPLLPRKFLLRGTGHDCNDLRVNPVSYVGTFQLRGGDLIFHLFEPAKH